MMMKTQKKKEKKFSILSEKQEGKIRIIKQAQGAILKRKKGRGTIRGEF